MISANDNLQKLERRIEIDCWLEGGAPYLVTMFEPTVQSAPIISEVYETIGDARIAAKSYARIQWSACIYDMTGEAS